MGIDDIDKRLAVCSWSLQPKDLDDLIRLVNEVGIPRIQLALTPIDEAPQQWADVGTRLKDAGIEIVSGMFQTIGEDYSTPQTIRETGGIVPDEHWEANWANIQRYADLAAQLNLSTVTAHAGFIPHDSHDPSYQRIMDRLLKIADLFKQRFDGWLLLETGQEEAETLQRLIEAMGRDNVGVNFDPANMLLYDMGDPVEGVKLLMPHVRSVHLKDACRPEQKGQWGLETPVGQGKVDWLAFLKVLKNAGYRGDLIFEREAGESRVEDIRSGAEHIRKLCANSESNPTDQQEHL